MDPKVMIDSITELDGVYGTFFSTMKSNVITAKVPPDHSSSYLQKIAKHGYRALKEAQKALPKCFEIRMDFGHITVLMMNLSDGAMFILIHNPKAIEFLRTAVYAICKTAILEQQKSLKLTQRISLVSPPKLPGVSEIAERSKNSEFVAVNPDLPSPQLVEKPRYIDEVLIGEGGTAFIYRAYDTRIKRTIALKRFKEEQLSEAKDDYLSELESASRIQHQNVVSTFDADIDATGRFMVMEFIPGEDLEIIVTRDPLPPHRLIDIATQTLEGLAATHRGGLLHLDIKPSNIMISTQGNGRDHVKVIDYGRARLINQEEENDQRVARGAGLNGSIHYASPEYLTEEELNESSDIYAAGCVFYWCLTGQRPFTGENSIQIMASHLQNQVTDLAELAPEIPKQLAQWVMSLIQLDPTDRPKTADIALQELKKVPTDMEQNKQDETLTEA